MSFILGGITAITALIEAGINLFTVIKSGHQAVKDGRNAVATLGNSPTSPTGPVWGSKFANMITVFDAYLTYMEGRMTGASRSATEWSAMTKATSSTLFDNASASVNSSLSRWGQIYLQSNKDQRLILESEGLRRIKDKGLLDFFLNVNNNLSYNLTKSVSTPDNVILENLVAGKYSKDVAEFLLAVTSTQSEASTQSEEGTCDVAMESYPFGYENNDVSGATENTGVFLLARSGMTARSLRTTSDNIRLPGASVPFASSSLNGLLATQKVLPALDTTDPQQALRKEAIDDAASYYQQIAGAIKAGVAADSHLTGSIVAKIKGCVRPTDTMLAINGADAVDVAITNQVSEQAVIGRISADFENSNGIVEKTYHDLPKEIWFPDANKEEVVTGMDVRTCFVTDSIRTVGYWMSSAPGYLSLRGQLLYNNFDDYEPIEFVSLVCRVKGVRQSSLKAHILAGKSVNFQYIGVYEGTYEPISHTIPNFVGTTIAAGVYTDYTFEQANTTKITYVGQIYQDTEVSGEDSIFFVNLPDPTQWPSQNVAGVDGPYSGNLFCTLQMHSDLSSPRRGDVVSLVSAIPSGRETIERGIERGLSVSRTYRPKTGAKGGLRYVDMDGQWKTLEGPIASIIGQFRTNGVGEDDSGELMPSMGTGDVVSWIKTHLPNATAWAGVWTYFARMNNLPRDITARQFLEQGLPDGTDITLQEAIKELLNICGTEIWFEDYLSINPGLSSLSIRS